LDDRHLSQIATRWSLVLAACRGADDPDQAAQAEFLERYAGAIYRYALRMLEDPDRAMEACQEFAMRFVRGDFRRADPDRGRFRDYLKTSVINLLREFQRQELVRGRQRPLTDFDAPIASDASPMEREERIYRESFRSELLEQAWQALAESQKESGPPYYVALRLKAENPGLSSADLAGRISPPAGRPYTASGTRQILHRARELFADRLLDEIARSASTEDPEVLEIEATELGLHSYCRDALRRRRG
jgi:RNA polymerase sigma factor (sigma-70 family)